MNYEELIQIKESFYFYRVGFVIEDGRYDLVFVLIFVGFFAGILMFLLSWPAEPKTFSMYVVTCIFSFWLPLLFAAPANFGSQFNRFRIILVQLVKVP